MSSFLLSCFSICSRVRSSPLDTIKVRTFREEEGICRELVLVKIRYNRDNRKDIMENCQIMGARIVDLGKSYMTIQMCDTLEEAG